MSNIVKLCPDLQQLIDDFVSVRQRFTDLAEAYVKQQLELNIQKSEIDNYKKEISSMKQIRSDKDQLAESYDRLKRDYDILYTSCAKQKEEIFKANDKNLRDLEEQLKAERGKHYEQAETHEMNIARLVSDYEAKLRDADEKIRRQLIRPRDETSTEIEKSERCSTTASKNPKFGRNKKWPELPLVQTNSRVAASRGRGRPRGAGARRKLFLSKNETPIDII